MTGAKIIEGLKQAIAGDLARVTIDGQTWLKLPRKPTPPFCPCCGAEEVEWNGPRANPEYVERDEQFGHLTAENEKLRAALEQIERMRTMPQHSLNTVTVLAARAIARKALGTADEQLLRDFK